MTSSAINGSLHLQRMDSSNRTAAKAGVHRLERNSGSSSSSSGDQSEESSIESQSHEYTKDEVDTSREATSSPVGSQAASVEGQVASGGGVMGKTGVEMGGKDGTEYLRRETVDYRGGAAQEASKARKEAGGGLQTLARMQQYGVVQNAEDMVPNVDGQRHNAMNPLYASIQLSQSSGGNEVGDGEMGEVRNGRNGRSSEVRNGRNSEIREVRNVGNSEVGNSEMGSEMGNSDIGSEMRNINRFVGKALPYQPPHERPARISPREFGQSGRRPGKVGSVRGTPGRTPGKVSATPGEVTATPGRRFGRAPGRTPGSVSATPGRTPGSVTATPGRLPGGAIGTPGASTRLPITSTRHPPGRYRSQALQPRPVPSLHPSTILDAPFDVSAFAPMPGYRGSSSPFRDESCADLKQINIQRRPLYTPAVLRSTTTLTDLDTGRPGSDTGQVARPRLVSTGSASSVPSLGSISSYWNFLRGSPPGDREAEPGPTRRHWRPDSARYSCHHCGRLLNYLTPVRRKHHCRYCGDIFCSDCLRNYIYLDQQAHFAVFGSSGEGSGSEGENYGGDEMNHDVSSGMNHDEGNEMNHDKGNEINYGGGDVMNHGNNQNNANATTSTEKKFLCKVCASCAQKYEDFVKLHSTRDHNLGSAADQAGGKKGSARRDTVKSQSGVPIDWDWSSF